MKQSEFHKAREGLNDAVVADRIEEYGTNFIKISVPPILYLVVHEVRIHNFISTFSKMLENNEIFDIISFFSSSIGVESILFVSSLYSNPLVRTTILEICCYHCHYIRHFRHSFRLGNKTGTYGYIFTVAFKNVVLLLNVYTCICTNLLNERIKK